MGNEGPKIVHEWVKITNRVQIWHNLGWGGGSVLSTHLAIHFSHPATCSWY